MTRPSDVDSLPSNPADPPGWHVREKTEDGYPLMGSSPAERQEGRERAERARRQAMRDHPFEGGHGLYCQRMGPACTPGGPDTGVVTMRVQCGWSRDMHPVTPSDHANALADRLITALGGPDTEVPPVCRPGCPDGCCS